MGLLTNNPDEYYRQLIFWRFDDLTNKISSSLSAALGTDKDTYHRQVLKSSSDYPLAVPQFEVQPEVLMGAVLLDMLDFKV